MKKILRIKYIVAYGLRGSRGNSREYVVVHVLREAHIICIAISVTLGIAVVQKSAKDTLIGAELCRKCSD